MSFGISFRNLIWRKKNVCSYRANFTQRKWTDSLNTEEIKHFICLVLSLFLFWVNLLEILRISSFAVVEIYNLVTISVIFRFQETCLRTVEPLTRIASSLEPIYGMIPCRKCDYKKYKIYGC